MNINELASCTKCGKMFVCRDSEIQYGVCKKCLLLDVKDEPPGEAKEVIMEMEQKTK